MKKKKRRFNKKKINGLTNAKQKFEINSTFDFSNSFEAQTLESQLQSY